MKSRKKNHQKHNCSKYISKAELPRLELTVNGIPVGELQLLPHSKHMSIHNGTEEETGDSYLTDLRKIPKSDFGRKFQEHYGMARKDDKKLYSREYNYYYNHGRCSWELEATKKTDFREGPKSDFGRKFQEHYGMTRKDDPMFYIRENTYYHRHGRKCRWELEDSKRKGIEAQKRYCSDPVHRVMLGLPKSDFGKKFQEHYGMTRADNSKLYRYEYSYFYRNHGRCRWEQLEDSKKSDLWKIPKSDFGRKFWEHYGIGYADDPKLYFREYHFYHNHGRKCRWELEFKNS